MKDRIKVDLTKDTGEIKYGGIGFLYGLGDDGIPSENVLAPLNLQVAAQKPPGGLQHPNGDAFEVAEMYKKAGGKQIQIYLQDIYADWPYEDQGIDDYLTKVEQIAEQVANHSHRDLFVYVPFNEPDAIWYNMDDKKEEFFNDWKLVYEKIREIDATALIAGSNNSYYNEEFYADFMAFAQENNCLPDIITWHELDTHFYVDWYKHYNSYRNIEESLGIFPKEIAINEYGTFMDLSVPGQLIQWLARFEDSKVDACLAYWHDAGALDDLAVENNKVTGAWWLYKWYSDMAGHTVEVTPPQKNEAGLQGIASLDNDKQEARLLLGGADGDTDIIIEGIDNKSYFNDSVHVKILSTEWTGQKGASNGPNLELAGNYKVVDGKLTVRIPDMDISAAYQMIITANSEGANYQKPWQVSYQAQDAKVTNASIYSGGYFDGTNLYNPKQNYNAQGQRVGDIIRDGSQVEFTVEVPDTGDYLMEIFYGNGHGDIAQQLLKVDDGKWDITKYPPTVDWQYESKKAINLHLEVGVHTITFAKYSSTVGRANLSVDLDKIDLTYLESDTNNQFSRVGYIESYAFNQDQGFVISVKENGYYVLKSNCNQQIIFLQAGINLISCCNASVDTIELKKGEGPISAYEAESSLNTLKGTATIKKNKYASGGEYVGKIGQGAENSLTFNQVNVSEAGSYKLVIYYANAEKSGGHDYNVDIVDRVADINVNGNRSKRIYFRNTFAWNYYQTTVVDVQLKAGDNRITFFNDTGFAPDIDKIEIYYNLFN
ncbi:CBM6-containing protein [Halobacteroides halobius DSM 5150]|uniref:CBM6-containing protein n=1 Tax=Halobacteroides halobius (strain ATCC 35273 / DSM 5150 / MD-1) TaxID=748449 RepID=L0KC46_HALHC|nr:CBM35 domain-containing protein [Halobacteroides halobius]AGB41658.1 CBM6-containing protein [Halobacteroides halobius DSM 5150]